eukprot:3835935-Rhodomonas_salina.3
MAYSRVPLVCLSAGQCAVLTSRYGAPYKQQYADSCRCVCSTPWPVLTCCTPLRHYRYCDSDRQSIDYAMSGTDMGYAATRRALSADKDHTKGWLAWVRFPAIVLRGCYALSGTDFRVSPYEVSHTDYADRPTRGGWLTSTFVPDARVYLYQAQLEEAAGNVNVAREKYREVRRFAISLRHQPTRATVLDLRTLVLTPEYTFTAGVQGEGGAWDGAAVAVVGEDGGEGGQRACGPGGVPAGDQALSQGQFTRDLLGDDT